MLPLLRLLAITVPLAWSAPDSGSSAILRYEARRCSNLDGCAPAQLYRDSTATDTTVTPAPYGERQRAWVVITEAPTFPYGWRRGGSCIQVRAVGHGSGRAPWSNSVDYAGGCNDSLYTNGRLWALADARHVVHFTRSADDSGLFVRGNPGPITDYETALNGQWRTYICSFAHRWALKGQPMSCTP